jgi:hypothetical protein
MIDDQNALEVIGKFEDSKQYRHSYDTKWDELYNMYRFKKKANRPGRANFYIPHAFSNVETVFPRMTSQRPRLNVKPVGPSDLEPAKLVAKLVDFVWERLNLDDVIRRWVKTSLIYGTGIVKVTWKKTSKPKKKKMPVLGKALELIGYETKSDGVIEYDGVVVTNLDLRDVYMDRNAVTVEDAEYIIHLYWEKPTVLAANPNYDEKQVALCVPGVTNEKLKRGLTETTDDSRKNWIEVLEYWEDDRLVVVAGGVLLRDDPNPYDCKKKPFVVMNDQTDDQVIYGIGEVEPIEGLQKEMNTLRNQRMDFNNLTLNPVWKVMPNAVSDINDIKFVPGHRIPMTSNDPGSITPLQMPQAPFTSYKEEESIRVDLQTITGVSDYARGSEATKMNDTATGISLIQEAANERFKAKIRNMESAISQMTELIVALYQQYATREMAIRITEKDTDYFETIDKKAIKGQFDIYVESGSTVPSNKMQQRSEEMNKYNVLMANPLFQSSPKAQLELTRALLEAWDDYNRDNVLASLEEAATAAETKMQEGAEASAMEAEVATLEKQIQDEMMMQNGQPQEQSGQSNTPVGQ